jgi:hypothetical protein
VSPDLRTVAVGSWAEYRTIHVGMKTHLTERFGLVARAGAVVDIETESPEMSEVPAGRMTLRRKISISDAELKLVETATQFANHDPTLLPPSSDPDMSPPFGRPDPKKRVGVESVTVPAGVFPKAEHYHVQLEGAETVDFWTSPDAPPFGLVKVVIAGTLGLFKGSTFELTALGTGAKPVIVKKPRARAPGEVSPEMEEALREIEKARQEDARRGAAKAPKKK